MDYCKLGTQEKTKTRRFKIIGLLAKGATPPEIQKSINKQLEAEEKKPLSLDMIYLDIRHINKLYAEGDDTTLAAIQAQGETFYQHMIRDLIRKAQDYESNPSVWLGIQKLLADLKEKDLKLKGAFVEKIEHTGEIRHVAVQWQKESENLPEPEKVEVSRRTIKKKKEAFKSKH